MLLMESAHASQFMPSILKIVVFIRFSVRPRTEAASINLRPGGNSKVKSWRQGPVRVRLGHSAMSARCPVCPKADTAGRFMSTRPKLLDGPTGDYSFPHSADSLRNCSLSPCSSRSRGNPWLPLHACALAYAMEPGARRANQPHWLPSPYPAPRRGRQDAIPDPPTHASPCLRVQTRERWPRHAGLCSTTSGTRTFSTRSGTPKWRPTGSKIFGGTDDDGADDSRTSTSTRTNPRSSFRWAFLIWLSSPAGRRTAKIVPFEEDDAPYRRDHSPAGGRTLRGMRSLGPTAVSASSISRFLGLGACAVAAAGAKSKPRKVSFASAGVGSGSHMAGELFKMMAGVDIVHVPYRGGGPALTDLLGGQVQLMFPGTIAAIEYIKAGTLRPLAVTTATRAEVLPNLPTVSDFVPGYESSLVDGIGAPKNTPLEIIEKLNREINAGLAHPKLRQHLADFGGTVLPGSPADYGRLIVAETNKWAKVIKFAGVRRVEFRQFIDVAFGSNSVIRRCRLNVRSARKQTRAGLLKAFWLNRKTVDPVTLVPACIARSKARSVPAGDARKDVTVYLWMRSSIKIRAITSSWRAA